MLPSPSPPPRPRPKKIVTQRQYREKEGVYFNTLRGIIKELTGEELPTRQEILKKAIDLLLATSDTRMQTDAQVVSSASHNVLPVNNGPAELTLSHADYFSQWEPYPCFQNLHPKGGFDSYIGVGRLHGQLLVDYFNADSRLDNSGSYQEHDEDSSARQWSYHDP